ncbi:hypothetical protein ABZ622_22295 [Streptomyces sp. NPDC007164]|uniref:hypothetical protein n=1 Tax=Streptomyces sp. NPDC007164 TaxID=3156918 RepID=UPI0034050E09
MKRNLACAATLASLVAGLFAVAAPSASASDVIFVNESGPGDAVISQVKLSPRHAERERQERHHG